MYGSAAARTSHVTAAGIAKSRTESASTAVVRAATSSEPRSRTFQAACRNAAASASASASGGTRERALRRVHEGAAEPAAERVPVLDLRRGLRLQPLGV